MPCHVELPIYLLLTGKREYSFREYQAGEGEKKKRDSALVLHYETLHLIPMNDSLGEPSIRTSERIASEVFSG